GRLGIIGGLSILGTTGIVIPYSCSSWIQAIRSGIDVARAAGLTHVAGSTGAESERAVQRMCGLPEIALIDMGDFVGGMLKYLRSHPVPRVTIAGGVGKMTKLAQGLLDLHSKRGSVDLVALAKLAACTFGKLGERHEVDRTAFGVKIEQPLGELGHLADAAGNGHPRHRMAAQIFQHAADEVAHVDQGYLGEAAHSLHRPLGLRTRRASDMREPRRARDVDSAPDRLDPGRAGIRNDDSRGAEDREATNDTEPAVHRLGGQRLPAWNGDLDLDIAWITVCRGDLGNRRAYHLPRHRVDGGLARRHRESRTRDCADAFAGAEANPAALRATADGGEDERAVGHVRVIAGVL